jgi:hypothetical protein
VNELPLHNRYPDKSASIEYDVFEEYPDGTAVWRACVCGMKEAEAKVMELRRETPNKLFALNLSDDLRAIVAPAGLPARRTVRRAG